MKGMYNKKFTKKTIIINLIVFIFSIFSVTALAGYSSPIKTADEATVSIKAMETTNTTKKDTDSTIASKSSSDTNVELDETDIQVVSESDAVLSNNTVPENTTVTETTVENIINESEEDEEDFEEVEEVEEEVEEEEEESTPVGTYEYCPTSINGTLFYCANINNPGEVKDGIYCNGTLVLTTTPGSWDSVQVCDPSVISGSFTFGGANYTFLMAYLGCSTYDCTVNEVGFAVSNDLVNWVKAGKAVSAVNDGCWGVGQPSIINYNGTIYLFYTSGTKEKTTTYVKQLFDTNFDNGIQLSDSVEITCSYDMISNADFAFSGTSLYMTCDTHPFPDGPLNFISAAQSIYKGEWDGTLDGLGNISWEKVTQIDATTTGHVRNHNGGFDRAGDGSLASNTVYVTTADEIGEFLDNLFTYRFQAFAF